MAASSDKSFVEDQIVYFINSEFTEGVRDLGKAGDLYKRFLETKKSLEEQLCVKSNEVPNEIKQAIRDADSATSKINQFSSEQSKLQEEVDDHVRKNENVTFRLSELANQIQELEKYTQYLEWVKRIEEISSAIQTSLLTDVLHKAISQYSDLASLVQSLQSSQCTGLVTFAQETVLFWFKILKERLSSDFEEVLKSVKWPVINTTVKDLRDPGVQNTPDTWEHLDVLFLELLKLKLPDGVSPDNQQTHYPLLSNIPGWKPLPLPMELLLRPLKKRFRYHFFGKKQTNSLEKPEWYFTQILTWIRDHSEFLRKRIQPTLKKAGLKHMDAKVEFIRGLIMVVMEKLVIDIPELMYDECLFSHTIDEALGFDSELRSNYGYPISEPGCLHVFTEEQAFQRWLTIEKKFAVEKMDAMLSSPSAWQSQYSSDVDDHKVPECAESFMTLMLTITDRYKPLPYPMCKLKFLDLQLDLLDEFRIRIVQVMKQEANNPLGRSFCAILNTVSYIIEVLQQWSELPFFLQLLYHRLEYETLQSSIHQQQRAEMQRMERESDEASRTSSRLASPEEISLSNTQLVDTFDESKLDQLSGTVFDKLIEYLELTKSEMLKNITDIISMDVKARSKPYRKDRWLTLPSQKEYAAMGLSSTACEMLLVLKEHLHTVQQLLSKPLFTMFWQRLAEDMDQFLYNKLVLANHFNEGGAAQLQYDMTRNLFPLFGEYTKKPENYFRYMKESCILLNLNIGSAILLKDLLYRSLHELHSDPNAPKEDPIAALQDVGVFRLSPDDAELVFSLRTNLSR